MYKSKFTGPEIDEILGKAMSSGGGIPIVDSEDKLDLNVPQGSLASVAYNTMGVTSFRDMYQPTIDILDQTNGTLTTPELLTSVQKLEWTFPENVQLTEEEIGFYLVPRSFSSDNVKIIMVHIDKDGIGGIGILSEVDIEEIIIATFQNGETTIYQDAINRVNDEILTADDWCYLSCPDFEFVITEEQFDIIDMFVKGVSGIQVTDLYIKESENFAQLCKKSETEKLITSKIDKVSKHLQGEIDEVAERIGIPVTRYSVGENLIIDLAPNTYIKHNQTGDLSISFTEPINNEIVNEYILELVCDGSSVTFPEGIRWKDNEIPVFIAGTTVIISVINNLAIAATFES